LKEKKRPLFNKKFFDILNYLQLIFYVCFLFLWFKDNIHPLKNINVSFLIPFIPLMAITFIRLFFKIRYKKINIQLRFNKVFLAVLVIILIAVGLRIPHLVYNSGLLGSDDAVPALMGKHISEGKLPPIYYYGQLYMGSLSQHFFAFMFFIFGYSVFLLKLSTLFFYLVFIIIQFLLIKEIFSFSFSLIISFFYCLPIGHLINVSFDNTGAYSLVLALGSSLIYISYLIYHRNRENLIPALGFLMGISFWAHQITLCFILTSLIIVAFKVRLHLRKYLTLSFFALIGSFPLLMQEIYEKFVLLRFLFPGRMQVMSWEKLERTAKQTVSLFSLENNPLNYIFFMLLLLGFMLLVYLSFRKKRLLPQTIYSLFFIIFYLMYLSSGFSNISVVRYLYPLYFCVPVLLIAVFLFLKSRIKYFISVALILILFFFLNLEKSHSGYLETKGRHLHLNRVIASMEETGERYWLGRYWTAYLITALAKEKIIVDSYTVNRYYPYRLYYYNRGQNNNFVFLRGKGHPEREHAEKLTNLMKILSIGFKKKTIGDCWLIYDVESPVFLNAFIGYVPSRIPSLDLAQVNSSKKYVHLVFKNEETVEDSGFRLHIEIPGYSSMVRGISLEKEVIKMRIPFPRKKSFKIEYYLDYMGHRIPSTLKEVSFSPSARHLRKRKKEIVYLSGFGPKVTVSDKQMRICAKEVKFEINKKLKQESRVRLHLDSPFQFYHPYWYGEYFQAVKIYVNDVYLREKRLDDGENVIEFVMRGTQFRKRANVCTLKFRYHLPFEFTPLWKTAALLDKIEVK